VREWVPKRGMEEPCGVLDFSTIFRFCGSVMAFDGVHLANMWKTARLEMFQILGSCSQTRGDEQCCR
jgi:hypothetical protein